MSSQRQKFPTPLPAEIRHAYFAPKWAEGYKIKFPKGYNAFRTRKEKCDVKTVYNDVLVVKGLFKWAAKQEQRELKMPEADLHSFRRFFATTMMRAGVDAETVRQWGGWKTMDTMLRSLADVTEKDSIKAMDEAVRKLAAS